jgi:hypothetical protein
MRLGSGTGVATRAGVLHGAAHLAEPPAGLGNLAVAAVGRAAAGVDLQLALFREFHSRPFLKFLRSLWTAR